MKRYQKTVVLMLALPLLLYGVPYAYAAQMSSTYALQNAFVDPANNILFLSISCTNPGDYATGGGYSMYHNGVLGKDLVVVYFEANPPVGANPSGWSMGVLNNNPAVDEAGSIQIVCQTPITVAGIGVPEFGSLYSAIALAAVLYFGLTILRQKRTASTIPAAK